MIKRIFGCIPFASIIVANALYGVCAYWVYQAMQEVPNDRTMPVLFGGVVGCAIMLNIGLFALSVRDLLWEYEEELKRFCRIIRVLCWRKGKRFKVVTLCALPFLFSLPCFAVSWQCGLLVSLFACMVSVCMLGGITAWRNGARPVSLIAGSMGLVYAYAMIRTLSEFGVFSLGDVSDVLFWVFMGQFFVALVVSTVAMFIADK